MNLSVIVDDTTARAALSEARRRGAPAMEAAMFRRAQDVLDVSDPLTPFRSGRLRSSHFATRTNPVEFGYAAPYAAAEHELHAMHPVGQWKFLETANNRIANEGVGAIERYFAAAFDAGESVTSAPSRYPDSANVGPAMSTRARPVSSRGR